MSEFAVGFVGGGSIARAHAEATAALGYDLRAVADVAEGARDAFAGDYGAEPFASHAEMLDAVGDRLDAVVVAVPNRYHADVAVDCLEAGVPVLVEKPLAHTLADARRVADAARGSDAPAVVGFNMAFEPATGVVRDALAAGEFGEVYEVGVEYVRRRGVPRLGSWFTRKADSGGGPVVDLGPHVLHVALAALGFPAVEAVSATTGTRFGDRADYTYLDMWGGGPTDEAAFDVEDHARALVRTAAGPVHLDVAWASNREPRKRVRVLGDEAGATFDPNGAAVTFHSTRHGGLATETVETTGANSFEREWQYVAAVVRGEREHARNTVAEGLAVQTVIEGVYESARRGAEVRVDEL
jgi:predicted dehydrogenase